MSATELFSRLFVPDSVREQTGDRAWLQAMLDAEAALAGAQAEAGLIPADATKAIAAACDASAFDAAAIGSEGHRSANPVPALVSALRERVGGEAAGFVHHGATSQDVMDTAAMLVAKRALEPIAAELDSVAAACSELADRYRGTPMAGRTLLQQASPTTFGLVAAGWLDSVVSVSERLDSISFAVQLGGASGTLASMGSHGERVAGLMAKRLGLEEPVLPWHTNRFRMGDLGASLGLAAGATEKVAHDLVLLSQTEVGEVSEPSGGGRGGSSAMPQKRNPVGSVLAIACARQVRAAVGTLLAAIPQEHQRAAGAWQSEWVPLTEGLAMTGGAIAGVREALDGLEVRPERMQENLDATGGLLMAESVAGALGERAGRARARELVDAAAERALGSGGSFRDELEGDDDVSSELSEQEIDRALDPAGHLGSADAFVDRALSRYRGDRGR